MEELNKGKALKIGPNVLSVGYDASLYLRAQYHFPRRKINKKTVPPLSKRYFRLAADLQWIRKYHIEINGLSEEES